MLLLEYHENIESYVTCIYMYQLLVKPLNSKLTKINLKERIKATTILLIIGMITLFNNIALKIKSIKNT